MNDSDEKVMQAHKEWIDALSGLSEAVSNLIDTTDTLVCNLQDLVADLKERYEVDV